MSGAKSPAMDGVIAYTDGACRGNPGPGGWGVLLTDSGAVRELAGAEPDTTNNRMELMAAIQALEAVAAARAVTVYTDSQYVQLGITQWLPQWKRRGWKTADRKPVKNQDLWQRLEAAALARQVEWRWVKGHSGDAGNDRVDALANAAIDAMFAAKR
jgi:ribonuclease HI